MNTTNSTHCWRGPNCQDPACDHQASVYDGLALAWDGGTARYGASAQVDLDGYRISLDERSQGEGQREWGKATRVYGAIDALVPELAAEEPYQGQHIPAQPDNAVERMRAKVWRAWRNATTREAADRLATLLGGLYQYDGLVMPTNAAHLASRFSQNAGCSMCPCSPGMVLDTTLRSERGWPVDVRVERLATWQVDIVRGWGDTLEVVHEAALVHEGTEDGALRAAREEWYTTLNADGAAKAGLRPRATVYCAGCRNVGAEHTCGAQ